MKDRDTGNDPPFADLCLTNAPGLPPIGRAHTSLPDAIAAALRQRILRGVLSAGERLTESRLCNQLGVSRIPVREALRTLAAEGLIDVAPRRGASVAHLSPTYVRDLINVQATLEGLGARMAAERRDDDAIAKLRTLLSDGQCAHQADDPVGLSEVNSRTHRLLGELASNPVLDELMRLLHDRTSMLFSPGDPKSAAQSWLEHAQIVEAVVRGDVELAALLAARHIHGAATRFTPSHSIADPTKP